jgi:Bifunctional DNA primase/polymerase, N-terminal
VTPVPPVLPWSEAYRPRYRLPSGTGINMASDLQGTGGTVVETPPPGAEALTVACQLHQRGLHLIPVDPETRLPLVPWGHVDDHGHPDGPRFRGGAVVGSGLPYSAWLFFWWSRWPGAGAAVLTGLSRLLVVDVDPRHDGHRSLLELAGELELPRTLVIATRSGGCHLYLRTRRLVRSTAGELGPGLDIRSHRGLAVCPPTPGYSILVDAPIAEAPAELVRRCPKPAAAGGRTVDRRPLEDPTAQAALAHALERIREAGEGERHDRLYGQARHLFNVTTDPAVDGMLLQTALEVGLSELEARRTIGDARRKAGG